MLVGVYSQSIYFDTLEMRFARDVVGALGVELHQEREGLRDACGSPQLSPYFSCPGKGLDARLTEAVLRPPRRFQYQTNGFVHYNLYRMETLTSLTLMDFRELSLTANISKLRSLRSLRIVRSRIVTPLPVDAIDSLKLLGTCIIDAWPFAESRVELDCSACAIPKRCTVLSPLECDPLCAVLAADGGNATAETYVNTEKDPLFGTYRSYGLTSDRPQMSLVRHAARFESYKAYPDYDGGFVPLANPAAACAFLDDDKKTGAVVANDICPPCEQGECRPALVATSSAAAVALAPADSAAACIAVVVTLSALAILSPLLLAL